MQKLGANQKLKSGIFYVLKSEICTGRIRNPASGIRNPQLGIQNLILSWITSHGATGLLHKLNFLDFKFTWSLTSRKLFFLCSRYPLVSLSIVYPIPIRRKVLYKYKSTCENTVSQMRFGSCLLRSSNGLPSVYKSSITVTDWRGILGWHTEQEEGECSWGLCSNHKTRFVASAWNRDMKDL